MKNKKILLIFVLLIPFIFVLVNLLNSYSSNPQYVVNRYLKEKMKSLVSTNTANFVKFYSSTENGKKYALFSQIEVLNDFIIAFTSGNYVIQKVNPIIKIEKVNIMDSSAVIEAILDADIYWNEINASGDPILANLSSKHTFYLIKESNGWKIDEDIYNCTSGNSEKIINDNSVQSLTNRAEDLKEQSKQMLNKVKKAN